MYFGCLRVNNLSPMPTLALIGWLEGDAAENRLSKNCKVLQSQAGKWLVRC